MTTLLGPDGSPVTLTGFDPDPGVGSEPDSHGVILNQTGLPDNLVEAAVATHVVENSELAFSQQTTFQTYVNQGGSLLARSHFRTPKDTFEEIRLARDLAERDDDVASTLGAIIALAYSEDMQNTHRDEVTVALFDEIAENMNLDHVNEECLREWLISFQINTVCLFTRESFSFIPEGTDRYRSRNVIAPLVGILPAEQVRVLNNDIVGTGTLAYLPSCANEELWLRERFEPSTTPARLRQMRNEDPVAYSMFTEQVIGDPLGDEDIAGLVLYKLNPRMVHRSTGPKGAWKYPRPLLTRNLPLLEAKRLLNIMDYAMLQGGANFLVVAKKGSDQKPALPAEIENLKEVVRRASRTGVMVGDHRLNIEIITPDLKELLNPEKRRLLGRKLAMAMLRLPEHMTENSGNEGMKAEVEVMSRVATHDRKHVRRHIERQVYKETARRNSTTFTQGPPSIWFPKIILQGTQFFTDYVLKLRDRGDIPRSAAVRAAGFDWEAGIEQRRREKESGIDDLMVPAQVPFTNPDAGPQDNNPGRTPGGPPSGPQQTIQRNPGETIKARYEEELGRVVRVGELTEAIMEDYSDSLHYGRVSKLEREAIDAEAAKQKGRLIVVPVNRGWEVDDLRAVRLDSDTSLIVGKRKYDGAAVTRALVFRTPHWSLPDAEDRAVRWGFNLDLRSPDETDPDNE